MLNERSQISVEIEAVEGTAETLVAADVISPAFEPTFEPSIEKHHRDPARSDLSQLVSLSGKRSGKIGFKAELAGAAAAGTAPMLSDALKACGLSETIVAVTSVTYKPASSSISSVTVGRHVDGKRNRIWGARGNAKLLLEAGKPGIFTFDFQGADFDDADEALLAGVTHSSIAPPIFVSASLTIDGYSAIITKVEFDFGNTLALRPDANSASGHKSVVITNRKPMLRFDPEAVLAATEDFLGNWRSNASMAFSAVLTGSAAGNIFTITAPAVNYHGLRETVRDGVLAYEIECGLAGSSGDDEWQIAIT
jgi:hypothetical protein